MHFIHTIICIANTNAFQWTQNGLGENKILSLLGHDGFCFIQMYSVSQNHILFDKMVNVTNDAR